MKRPGERKRRDGEPGGKAWERVKQFRQERGLPAKPPKGVEPAKGKSRPKRAGK